MDYFILAILIGGLAACMVIQSERHEQRIERLSTAQSDRWDAVNQRLVGIIEGGSEGLGEPNNRPTVDELSARLRDIASGTYGGTEGGDGGRYTGYYGTVGDDPTDQDWPTPTGEGTNNRVAIIEPGTNLLADLTGMQHDGVPHDLSGELYDEEDH